MGICVIYLFFFVCAASQRQEALWKLENHFYQQHYPNTAIATKALSAYFSRIFFIPSNTAPTTQHFLDILLMLIGLSSSVSTLCRNPSELFWNVSSRDFFPSHKAGTGRWVFIKGMQNLPNIEIFSWSGVWWKFVDYLSRYVKGKLIIPEPRFTFDYWRKWFVH